MRQLLLSVLLLATPSLSADPQVKAVLFYSTRCPHCHTVIREDLPPIVEKYGDDLQILYVNVSSPSGRKLYDTATDWLPIPNDKRGVPAVLVGRTLLVGKNEIPNQLPGVIDRGLAEGGVPYPKLPGLRARIPAEKKASLFFFLETPSITTNLDDVLEMEGSVWDRVARDPLGSAVAIALLVVMLYSLLRAAKGWWRRGLPGGLPVGWRSWTTGALAVTGFCISLYLSVMDSTGSAVVCGPLGDCDAVQQSPYAWVFGVIPVALLGTLGYAVILGLWIWQRITTYKQELVHGALTMMIFFGVQFSIYLTFLEPFVIGAVCLWCLTSALIMTSLLWLIDPEGYPRLL
jgi:uncharacterized membrane protein